MPSQQHSTDTAPAHGSLALTTSPARMHVAIHATQCGDQKVSSGSPRPLHHHTLYSLEATPHTVVCGC